MISITTRSDKEKKPELLISKVRADAVFPVFSRPAAFTSREPIILSRALANVNQPKTLILQKFKATAGRWMVKFTSSSNLHSPDNSYSGVLKLVARDGADRVIESFTVADVFGKNQPGPAEKIFEFPEGTVSAQFEAKLNKTHGEFRIDHLTASYLAPAPLRDDKIERPPFFHGPAR